MKPRIARNSTWENTLIMQADVKLEDSHDFSRSQTLAGERTAQCGKTPIFKRVSGSQLLMPKE